MAINEDYLRARERDLEDCYGCMIDGDDFTPLFVEIRRLQRFANEVKRMHDEECTMGDIGNALEGLKGGSSDGDQ